MSFSSTAACEIGKLSAGGAEEKVCQSSRGANGIMEEGALRDFGVISICSSLISQCICRRKRASAT